MRLFLSSISILLLLALLGSMFFYPNITTWISITLLILSIGMAVFLTSQRHWQTYQQAECTREKMARNIFLDLSGLLLAMAVASLAGKQAGQWTGMQAGLWAGLIAGFVVGFLAAWVVRSLWGKVVGALA